MLTAKKYASGVRRGALLALWVTGAVLGGFAFGESPARRFPVTSEMIASAMQHRQLSVEGAQIRLAAPITSSVSNPMLDIESVQRTTPQTAQLRVGCRNRTECLSFYVSVTWPESASLSPEVSDADPTGREPGLNEMNGLTNVRSNGRQRRSREEQGTLRPGTPATLLIEEGRVHITLRVVALGRGVTGDKVRVATPDHRLTYQAEVVSPTLLKGTLLK